MVFKDRDDGSEALSAYLAAHGLTKGRLLICRMNTDACWTVYASRSAEPQYNALSRMRKFVSIVKTEAVR
uniref:DUF5659 domain-containing protein n=1 Tax=candidate division WWE3 bacterium TaxID=2053526 RepID=A0A832E0V4_UNCKA